MFASVPRCSFHEAEAVAIYIINLVLSLSVGLILHSAAGSVL